MNGDIVLTICQLVFQGSMVALMLYVFLHS